MTKHFTQSQLEAIAGAMGDTNDGLTGSETLSQRSRLATALHFTTFGFFLQPTELHKNNV